MYIFCIGMFGEPGLPRGIMAIKEMLFLALSYLFEIMHPSSVGMV